MSPGRPSRQVIDRFRPDSNQETTESEIEARNPAKSTGEVRKKGGTQQNPQEHTAQPEKSARPDGIQEREIRNKPNSRQNPQKTKKFLITPPFLYLQWVAFVLLCSAVNVFEFAVNYC